MRSRLEKRLRRSGRHARLVDAPAERLPFADGSVDTVVSTFVLCTVDAPDLALREIARVLRPDGQFLFFEHVRSDSPTLASWQDRLVRAVASLRERLSLQPRDRGADRDAADSTLDDVHEGVMARNAADRPAAHRRRAQTDRRPTPTHASPTTVSASTRAGHRCLRRVGLFPPHPPTAIRSGCARRSLAVADAGVDHLCVGDHVSFFVGAGSDGLITRNLPARGAG